MIDQMLLHPVTLRNTKSILHSKPHAVLINGNDGAGKLEIANAIVSDILGITTIDNNPNVLVVLPDKSQIGIAEIRSIRNFISRKSPGSNEIKRCILIPNAQTMTSDAQNALLKTLEEPPADTILILTTNNITALKPTVRSRTTHLSVLPVSQAQSIKRFRSTNIAEKDIITAFYLSGGEVGLMSALIADSTEHELVKVIQSAKQILGATRYERLTMVDEMSKQKDSLSKLLLGLQKVATGGLRQATGTNNASKTKQFYSLNRSILLARTTLDRNTNAKLVLTRLFLSM